MKNAPSMRGDQEQAIDIGKLIVKPPPQQER